MVDSLGRMHRPSAKVFQAQPETVLSIGALETQRNTHKAGLDLRAADVLIQHKTIKKHLHKTVGWEAVQCTNTVCRIMYK